jgi:glycosyltransferase involved in cell wall biosynthesis
VSPPRVLIAHNRYRVEGGEERAVALHARALAGAGIEHRVLVRDSGGTGRARAAAALLAGGERPGEFAAALRDLGASVLHVHNMQPLLGPRALRAARAAGARVVLHLHNYRLFCSIGVSFRFGEPCFRCRRGLTLPGLVLDCRRSLPESAAYATALATQLDAVLEAVDAFVAPSEFAAGQLARLGVPADRLHAVPHYLPAELLAERSRADEGDYALALSRLAPEKGMDTAIEAAALAGVPLRIAGDGPQAGELRALVARLRAPVELLGGVPREEAARLVAGAAAVVVPTRGTETFGFSALEAMGAGVPVVAARTGALPEIAGPERCVRRSDPAALAAELARLWADPAGRRAEGEAALARARERFSERAFLERLLPLY